jgi:hypothetical protein
VRLTVRLLGLELLTIEASTDDAAEADEDTERDLSGGTLGTERIEAGPTDRYMGFTNGREVDL